MSYPKEILDAGHAVLSRRRENARTALAARREEIGARFPHVLALERKLATTSAQLARLILGGEDVPAKLKVLRQSNLECQRRMEEELTRAGYSADCLSVRYHCPLCQDKGYTENGMCACFRTVLRDLMYERLGAAAALMSDCSFDNFRLDYYPNVPVSGSELIPRKTMAEVSERCRQYADRFSPGSDNLLMSGPAGLGKTHLSLAIAKAVVDRGFDVIYTPFHLLLTQLEENRFGRGSADYAACVEPVLRCDLLILDDLGSEFATSFAAAALYDIVNTRLTTGASMIINTNLDLKELEQRYSPRLVSRLAGSFKTLPFRGNDIRLLKRFGGLSSPV
jgi:DNA replication protein DnaC